MTVRRFHAEVATALGTAVLGGIAILGANELGHGWSESGPQSGYFPFYVGLILIAASLWNLAAAFIRHGSARGEGDDIEEPFLDKERLHRLGGFLGTMLVYVLVTLVMGIYVGSALYIAWSAWRQGGYRPSLALAVGIGFSVALYLVFEVAFLMPLLKGPIEPLFGIY